MALNINVIEREMEDKEITLDTVLNIWPKYNLAQTLLK